MQEAGGKIVAAVLPLLVNVSFRVSVASEESLIYRGTLPIEVKIPRSPCPPLCGGGALGVARNDTSWLLIARVLAGVDCDQTTAGTRPENDGATDSSVASFDSRSGC